MEIIFDKQLLDPRRGLGSIALVSGSSVETSSAVMQRRKALFSAKKQDLIDALISSSVILPHQKTRALDWVSNRTASALSFVAATPIPTAPPTVNGG